MAHFAKVESGIVTEVIVAEQEHIDTLSGTWIQTSYNTSGGQHLNGKTPLRKNFAGKGYIYDSDKDAFYMPQPYNSWTLNEDSCEWQPPTAYPDDGKLYWWDESTTSWKE